MTDKTIILSFLAKEFPDSHPAIYIYVCGQKRSEQTAINKLMDLTRIVFCPPLHNEYVLEIVKQYLKNKKENYKKGLIKVKPYYA